MLCPLCTVANETLDHLSLHRVFSQGVWSGLVARLGLPNIVPTGDTDINDWWLLAAAGFPPAARKKANSFIMLTMRMLWLERNARVFLWEARADACRPYPSAGGVESLVGL
jgi:hypothetical protein